MQFFSEIVQMHLKRYLLWLGTATVEKDVSLYIFCFKLFFNIILIQTIVPSFLYLNICLCFSFNLSVCALKIFGVNLQGLYVH